MQRAVTCPRPARQKGSGSKKKRRRFVLAILAGGFTHLIF